VLGIKKNFNNNGKTVGFLKKRKKKNKNFGLPQNVVFLNRKNSESCSKKD